MNKAIFCVGYDVENGRVKITRKFLKSMLKVHEKYEVPATLFVVGKTLEQNIEQFKELVDHPLIDFQQHTYSHLIFKKIHMKVDGVESSVGEDEPIEKIRSELERANASFKTNLGVKVEGLTTPYAFYQGLMDRPDILQALQDNGIKFVRSYARNERGYSPVPLTVQPFFYADQGFPDILECPIQGWQDCIWRDTFGWKANWERKVQTNLAEIEETKTYFGYVQHDWSSIKEDPKMERTAKIFEFARSRNIKIMQYKDLYDIKIAERN